MKKIWLYKATYKHLSIKMYLFIYFDWLIDLLSGR